jgi:hypothetical protein
MPAGAQISSCISYKSFFADSRIVLRRFWFSASKADHRVHKIAARYNSYDFLAAHNRHSFDAAALHQFHDVFKVRIFGDSMNIRRHDVGDFAAMGMGVLDSKFAGAHEEFKPSRTFAFGPGLATAEEITLGQNADHLSAFVDDWQTADMVLQHLSRCLKDCGIRLHRNNGTAHYLFGFHDQPPIIY